MDDNKKNFKFRVFLFFIGLCLIPFLIWCLGFDFSFISPSNQLALLVHTLLEWGAFLTAAFTAYLALSHYRVTQNYVTLMIGMALLSAGIIDLFHILAADQILPTQAHIRDFIPFTWALCRLFNSGIILLGCILLLYRTAWFEQTDKVITTCSFFILLPFVAILMSIYLPYLPQTQFSPPIWGWLSRPYDLIPLFIYLSLIVFVYPQLYKKFPGLFTYGLLLSAVPDISAQVYMIFGSQALFDHWFYSAHGLKILAYLIPLWGLTTEYNRGYQKDLALLTKLQEQETKLHESYTRLHQRNQILKDMSYIHAHNLRGPLGNIIALLELIQRKRSDSSTLDTYLDLVEKSVHQSLKVVDQLNLALKELHIQAPQLKSTPQQFAKVFMETQEQLTAEIEAKEAQIHGDFSACPELEYPQIYLQSIFYNLLSNALKYANPQRKPKISFRSFKTDNKTILTCKDNGLGLDLEKYGDRLFRLYHTFHDHSEAQGIGLFITKNQITSMGGTIEVESHPGQGCLFTIRF